MSKRWTCPHGVGPEMKRGDCDDCNAELASRPDPSALPHPTDLAAHAIESLKAVAGDKPIIVVKASR